MKDEHRKDIVLGVYNTYDEETRFEHLRDFVQNHKRVPLEFKRLILDNSWQHSDRPDWKNDHLNVAIEDTTVEDTNHYLDKHFSKRTYTRINKFKNMTRGQRIQYLKSIRRPVDKNVVDTGRLEEITTHIPSNETVLRMNKGRSVNKWLSAIKKALNKHRQMLSESPYKEKYIYLYDVTPPYMVKNHALVELDEYFDPTSNETFIHLFDGYPAKIIWYLPTQATLVIIDPNEIYQLHNLEGRSLIDLEPTYPIYDSTKTYLQYRSEIEELMGDHFYGADNYLIDS